MSEMFEACSYESESLGPGCRRASFTQAGQHNFSHQRMQAEVWAEYELGLRKIAGKLLTMVLQVCHDMDPRRQEIRQHQDSPRAA